MKIQFYIPLSSIHPIEIRIYSLKKEALELLAIKNFPKHPLAPATQKFYGEMGVLI
jgi:hypothetical protein